MIINQETFSERDGGNRKGSKLDVSSLKETFGYLNSEVRIVVDLDLLDLQLTLQETANYLNRHRDKFAFVCIALLSHGDEDYIKCTDGEGICIEEVKQYFDSRSCRGMNGKPKLLIRNACRGRTVLKVEVFENRLKITKH